MSNHPSRLFRTAALNAHARRLEGEVLVVQPLNVRVVAAILSAFAIAALVFLMNVGYARTERVTGYLVPRGGVSTMLPSRPGTVTDVLVEIGDSVRAGDVVMRVASQSALNDGTPLEGGLEVALRLQRTQLEQKAAFLETTLSVTEGKLRRALVQLAKRREQLSGLESVARERLELARRRQDALGELLNKGIVSEKDYQTQADLVLGLDADLRQAHYDVLEQDDARRAIEAELQLAPTDSARQKADLNIQMLNVDAQLQELSGRKAYAMLAPISGRIASLQAAPGNEVSPDVPVAIVIPETSELEAHLLVPTRAAGLIEVDQRVGIEYAAFPSATFGIKSGRIRRIDTAVLGADAVQGPVTVDEPVYRVIAALDEQAVETLGRSYRLQPGMRLEADITLETRTFIAWILEPLYGTKPRSTGASAS